MPILYIYREDEMEQLQKNEQTELHTHTAEADNDLGGATNSVSLEKFKDVQSLLKAYNSLEAEFTKRSQRLRKLEGENEMLTKQLEIKKLELDKDSSAVSKTSFEDGEAVLTDFFNRYPEARLYEEELSRIVDGKQGGGVLEKGYIELLSDKLKKQTEQFESREYLISQIENSEIKDEIIKDFLSGILTSTPKPLLSGGEIALTPPIRPKSLQEARILAEEYFK